MPNSSPALIRPLRSVLEKAQDAIPIAELLTIVDEFVLKCSASDEREVLVFHLEEELQSIHNELIDYSALYQLEVFLAVLYHLGPVLPPTSIISWFDLVLRPALREPKLPSASVHHTKELIISALQKTQDVYATNVSDFRRRLLELYLLDAFNESSGEDVLEWAELSQEEKNKRTQWKINLEDVLVAYGHERPEDLLTEIDHQFAVPSSRLQLTMLLNVFASSPRFSLSVSHFAGHRIMKSLANSLFLDSSSTVCTTGITLIVKLLPYYAVHTREFLKVTLPKLLAILARIMCWKERPPSRNTLWSRADEEFERELHRETNRILHIRPDLDWKRLEMTFNATTSPPPSSRPYFTILYYLYPSNVLKFLRGPAKYLEEANLRTPYTQSWEQAFDQDEIKRRSENLLREHICHPLLIWSDATLELSKPEFWSRYDISRITSEATMLDIRNLAIGLRERYGTGKSSQVTEQGHEAASEDTEELAPEDERTHFVRPIDISSGKVVISLQDMINTSVALKSNVDVEITMPVSRWPHEIFPPPGALASHERIVTVPTSSDDGQNMAHVAEAISGLQREVLLLRNELNFELWHSRENAKHIGRLYQDRVLMRTAEHERQGLYNKLRKYRTQVTSLESDLHDYKQQSAAAKSRYVDWTKELQDRLKELREEKKAWLSEAAALRSAERDIKALFDAQGNRLAEALDEVFQLQAQRKMNEEKMVLLPEYEQQIEDLTKKRHVWEDDSRKFNQRGEELERLRGAYKELKARLEKAETAREATGDNSSEYRRQIQSLELRLAQIEDIVPRHAGPVNPPEQRLRVENAILKNEVEELQGIVASLKGQST